MKKDWILKNLLWMIFIIILLLTTIFLSFKLVSSFKERNKLTSENEELQASLGDQRNLTDLYVAKLDTCEKGIEKPLTTEEKLARVEAENERLKSQQVVVKPVTVKQAPVKKKRVAVKKDVTETSFRSETFVPVTRTSSTLTVASNNVTSNTQYKAVLKGDIGTTINASLNPVYYIKGSNSIKSAAFWCGDSNKKMNYDSETGYWFYIDVSRILSGQELSDQSFVLLWNIRTGTINWGGGSYETWLPHEEIKPLLNSVRGFEYGFITDSDLNQMSQKDSRIWSQNNPTGIYQPLLNVGVHERTDVNFWQGWNYRTKVNFQRITN